MLLVAGVGSAEPVAANSGGAAASYARCIRYPRGWRRMAFRPAVSLLVILHFSLLAFVLLRSRRVRTADSLSARCFLDGCFLTSPRPDPLTLHHRQRCPDAVRLRVPLRPLERNRRRTLPVGGGDGPAVVRGREPVRAATHGGRPTSPAGRPPRRPGASLRRLRGFVHSGGPVMRSAGHGGPAWLLASGATSAAMRTSPSRGEGPRSPL